MVKSKINGSGKSSVMAEVEKYLASTGQKFIRSREPGGTQLGEKIRALLLHGEDDQMEPLTAALLFSAARHQHVKEVIIPNIESGTHVLCDRFVTSSVAFQGHGQGINPDVIRGINEYATIGVKPDLTIVLDLPLEVAEERIRARNGDKDRFEGFDVAFQQRVREGYLKEAHRNPNKFEVVNAGQSFEDVVAECIGLIKKRLNA